MPRKVAVSTLNASTIDILNVIRDNASLAYQNAVPAVQTATDIPKVGEVIYGTPAFANEFINALVNRIAIVRVKSATFNNPYARLKKGFIEYGETIEEIFVGITQAFTFSQEKAENRELKQYKPNVKSAFHAMNWKVLYPVSISIDQLKQAFLSSEGVTDLISKIVDAVYTAANYDEFLLFKYLIIKSVTTGKMKPIAVDGSSMNNYAVAFRGKSNMLPFMSSEYNEAGVKNTTPRERQIIMMDAEFNASFDVNVLAAAFHMEKADFMGSLFLVDSFSTFDNDRFAVIRSESDGLEEVTADELTLMKKVKAILVDEDWFQVYDNLALFAEKYIASGLRWNYFYHTWKTISVSPFANAIVFVDNTADITYPETINVTVKSIDTDSAGNKVITLDPDIEGFAGIGLSFPQTLTAVQNFVGIQPYGAIYVPASYNDANIGVNIFNADRTVKYRPVVTGVVQQGGYLHLNDLTVGLVLAFERYY